MKKFVFIILLIATGIMGCKNTEKQEEIKNTEEVVHEQETDILSTSWMDDIQLNNGAKWEANIETTDGVIKMQKILKSQATSSIEEYHQLAGNLNEVKNKVVKECTMKGPSHDNLHIWLYPLIENIGALSETNNIVEASKIKKTIVENIDAYNNYFE